MVVRGALALALLALCVGTARAQGTFTISLSQCGTPDNGFQFTINGAGAVPTQALEIVVTTSEAGAFPEPFYVLPTGVSDPNVLLTASINPDGTFSFVFSAGSNQQLPATIAVYAYDTATDTAASTLFYTTTVDRSTTCTDGTLLGGSSGGGGGGGSGGGGVPTTMAQCKDGGWKTYLVFRNQGDCVSFVRTGGKNLPALVP